jgi:ferredoxin
VVSVPKLKTHSLTIMTGAVKNLFGLVPGYAKTNYHRLYAHPVDISRVFVEIQAIVRPVLHVMDAIVGMQGNGPSGGYPGKLGFVAAGADPVAMDAICADILGISRPAEKISMLSQAVEKGLGVADPALIDVLGAEPASLRPEKFVLPETAHFRLIPRWVSPLVARLLWIRPEFTEACGGCGLCVKSCPVEAIAMSEGRPRFKGGRCIECLCCQEVCPNRAINIRFSRIAKLIMR